MNDPKNPFERFPEADRLFAAALAEPADARQAFLAAIAAEDPELGAAVKDLLRLAEEEDALLVQGGALAGGLGEAFAGESAETSGAAPDPLLGRRVGHYRIEGRLGSGGMGVVYRAFDIRLEREVALKVLPPHLSLDAEAKERFLVEARAAAALNHPNICTVHEIGETEDGRLFIAMACYEGETLKERLAGGALPVAEAAAIAAHIARGLGAAHARGVVHRDVKPGNVMLTRDGAVRLVDFGLAKVADVSLTRAGVTPGTVAYMSPEQARGALVDHRTDLWSLGVVLYEMVAGAPPFRGEGDRAVFHSILHEEPEPLGQLRRETPQPVIGVVERLLRKDPAARYGTAEELAADLEEVSTGGRLPAASAIASSATRWRLTATLGALATLLALAVVTVVRWPSRQPVPWPASPAPRQITFSGEAFAPALSPDGDVLAYLTPDGQLRIHDIGSGEEISILQEAGPHPHYAGPAWSPDGSHLLVGASAEDRLYLLPRFGGQPRKYAYYQFYSWDPDGTRFAGTWPPWKTVDLVDVATGAKTSLALTAPFQWLEDVDWSPLGDRLAVLTSDDRGRFTIWTLPIQGGPQVEVHEEEEGIGSLNWSPAGDAIYYAREGNVWRVGISPSSGERASEPMRILSGGHWGPFSIAANGSRLASARTAPRSNLWLGSLMVGAETELETQWLTHGTARHDGASFSPDGTELAFVREQGEESDIFVLSLSDREVRRLTFSGSRNGAPAWSPDGRRIAFASSAGGSNRIWLVEREGGTPLPLPGPEVSVHLALTWAPHREILVQSPDIRTWRYVDPETGAQRRLIDDSLGWFFDPVHTADGERLAVRVNYGRSRYAVWSIPVSGTPAEATLLTGPPDLGAVIQRVSAAPYRGDRVKLRASVRTETSEQESFAHLWLKSVRAGEPTAMFSYREDAPLRSVEWARFDAEIDVDRDAKTIVFGALLAGAGRAWIDDLELLVAAEGEPWRPLPIENPGFEEAGEGGEVPGWRTTGLGYSHLLVEDDRPAGGRSLRIDGPIIGERSVPSLEWPVPLGWSPDGDFLYVGVWSAPVEGELTAIVKISASGGDPETVVSQPFPGSVREASISPDGRQYVLNIGEELSDIWLVDDFDPDIR